MLEKLLPLFFNFTKKDKTQYSTLLFPACCSLWMSGQVSILDGTLSWVMHEELYVFDNSNWMQSQDVGNLSILYYLSHYT